ncbi:MAG TPA: penicillin-binding protein [Candidatus Binataceae bacterium]|nr:penicillin-binding protein [Candidatus Binataceae bacterium]
MLTVVLAGLFVLTGIRLSIIVLVDGPRLVSLAHNEHTSEMDLAAVRGPIVDRNGTPLALSAETRSIYSRPRILLENSSRAERARMAALLGLSSAELESRLGRGAPFVWLARHLASDQARAVEELGLEGVGTVSEYKRFYPESNLAAAVVGMAGTDGQGLSGVELQYDKLVRGEPVVLRFYHDALGRPILDSPMELKNPEPGARLVLTIDSSIQSEAENFLGNEIKQSGARRGSAVVLDPFTGEVLALANVGSRNVRGGDRLHDAAVQDAFEPGSTMKGLLGSIALEDQVINTSRVFFCEQGEWHLAGRTIHDDSPHGWLNLGGVIEVSSNIGAAKIALALGAQRFGQGLSAFGLGRKTGIDLPGEARGLLSAPTSWHEIDLADHGFGQGVAVTPIQLATAYAAIANGGVVMRPYVVKAAYDAEGHELLEHTPQALHRAISPTVAHTMNMLLRGVVNGQDGTAHLAQVADFMVAGKTGTAQMVNPATGTYYHDRLVASFVGFVPAEDPKLVVLVVLYDVPNGHFGGLVAAPVFSEIASAALQRMDVAPAHPALETASLLPFAGEGNAASGVDGGPDGADGDGLASQARNVEAVTAGSPMGPRTPDFHGLSLRGALALARERKLAIEVQGSGYVVRQLPAAGSVATGGAVRIVLGEPGVRNETLETSGRASLRVASRTFDTPTLPEGRRGRALQ